MSPLTPQGAQAAGAEAASAEAAGGDRPPRADLRDAVGWVALGGLVLYGSWTMDRLEQQNINPYTAPGLLPGLLGLLMIVLGCVLGARSLRRGARHRPDAAVGPLQREEFRRIVVVTALCFAYAVILIGHGLPFWAASTVYVAGSILILQRIGSVSDARDRTTAALGRALLIGTVSSVIVHVVFQELFLVRLP